MSSDDNSDEDINCTPPELRAEAALAMNNLLPAKSKEKYMNTYQNFISWKTDKNAHGFSENVFLAYFTELARTKKSSTLCVNSCATLNLVENKKYDVEEQSNIEYGMDLKSVLRQFRRSSDYLKILQMRAGKDFELFFTDVMYQSLDWNVNRMKQRIAADFGLNDTKSSSLGTTDRTVPPNSTSIARHRVLRSKISGRRQADPHYEEREKALEKVRRIDDYPKLRSYLTVDERNHYKDIGFEYAGEVIHATIHAMGGSLMEEPTTSGSTRLTFPGHTFGSTTAHVLKHIPTRMPGASKEMKSNVGQTKRSNKRFVLVSRLNPLGGGV